MGGGGGGGEENKNNKKTKPIKKRGTKAFFKKRLSCHCKNSPMMVDPIVV
jgi:hypothetical protein